MSIYQRHSSVLHILRHFYILGFNLSESTFILMFLNIVRNLSVVERDSCNDETKRALSSFMAAKSDMVHTKVE